MTRASRPFDVVRGFAILAAALGAMGPAAADEPPVALYAPAAGLVQRHRIEKGAYHVAFELTRALIAPEVGDPKTFVAPRSTVRVPVPEAGAFAGAQAFGGAFVKATVTLDGSTLVLALVHQGYRPPSPQVVASLAPTEVGLAPTLEAIARNWNGDQGRKLQAALVTAARKGQGVQAQRHLTALGHCYAGELEPAVKLGESTLRELAKLMAVDTAGTPEVVAARLSAALSGGRVVARFVPDPATRRLPTRGSVAGEVGRATLRGEILPGELDDWWELEVAPGVQVGDLEAPAGLAWFVIEDKTEPAKLRIRVHGRTATPLAYALLVRSATGSEARSIELHERPADSPGLPYE